MSNRRDEIWNCIFCCTLFDFDEKLFSDRFFTENNLSILNYIHFLLHRACDCIATLKYCIIEHSNFELGFERMQMKI